MSDSITIKEGGASRAFGPVSRLRVLKQGTGTEDFVPESATSETTKSITENGTYFAAQDNAYGYSQVSVNCNQEADSLTGKGQDGNEYNVRKDSSGNIVETLVPSFVVCGSPLDITYNNGEAIDLTGFVMHAYDGEGNPWTYDGKYPDGAIPNSEISISPSVAYFDQGMWHDEALMTTEYYSDADTGPFEQPIRARKYYSFTHVNSGNVDINTTVDGAMVCIRGNDGAYNLLRVAKDGNVTFHHKNSVVDRDETLSYVGYYHNIPVHYDSLGFSSYHTTDDYYIQSPYPSYSNIFPNYYLQAGYTMLYGTPGRLLNTLQVTASWRCPVNNQNFTGTFDVFVAAPAGFGGATGGGGQAGGTGAGRND